MSWSMTRRLAMMSLGLGVVLLAPLKGYAGGGAPTGGATGGMPVLTVFSRQFQVQMPGAVTAGYVAIKYVNNGGIWSGVAISRLKNGGTASQVAAAYRAGNQQAISRFTDSLGGIGIASGSQLITKLVPGDYVIGDTEQTAKHKTLVAVRSFTVLPGYGAPQAAPTATVNVHLVNFKFHMPTTIAAGLNTFELMNMANQPHEMILFKLSPGKTLADVISYLKTQQGQPPGSPVGGLFDLDPGNTSYLRLGVPAGNYVALCFVTDPKTHLPHAALGMVMPFTAR
jgi:hypothetical protein